MSSRLAWISNVSDLEADAVDAYTLDPIAPGSMYVSCDRCHRVYQMATFYDPAVRMSGFYWNRCPGCRSGQMRHAIRAGGDPIKPDPTIVPGRFVTLRNAVRAASLAGSGVVCVPSGVYRGTLKVRRGVRIVAHEPGNVEIVSTGAPALDVVESVAQIVGVVFRMEADRAAAPTSAYSAAVSIRSGALAIDRCTILALAGDGVSVSGPNAAAVATLSTIQRASGYGINLQGQTEATLDRVTVGPSAFAGLRVADARVAATDLTIDGECAVGIAIVGASRGRIERFDVRGARRNGISVVGPHATAVLVDGTVRGGDGAGILVSDGAAPTFDRVTVHGQSGVGVEARNGGNPTLRQCTVRGGGAVVVRTRDGGRGVFRDCTIERDGAVVALDLSRDTRIIQSRRAARRSSADVDLALSSRNGRRRRRGSWRLEYLIAAGNIPAAVRFGITAPRTAIARADGGLGRGLLPVVTDAGAGWLPGGAAFGDFVPVYLNARNGRLRDYMANPENAVAGASPCIVRLATSITRRGTTIVCDGDPSSAQTRYMSVTEARTLLNMDDVDRRITVDASDSPDEAERLRRMHAMVLIPGMIAPRLIREVLVPNDAAAAHLTERLDAEMGARWRTMATVSVCPDRFFTAVHPPVAPDASRIRWVE